jgi:glucosamine--fructose-6-phosphate aminotransferase (isomerizing)
LWQTLLPLPARGVPAGELWLYPEVTLPPPDERQALLIAVSRSGATSETVAVTEEFRHEGRGKVVVITAYPEAPLARLGDVTIPLPSGQEESLVQTRSFAAMYVAATALMVTLAGREDLLQAMARLPACGRAIVDRSHAVAREWGENLEISRFYFLGSGPRYGLACETNLKMKEMTLSDSEPFHFFEFRHGPMSMVSGTTAIIGLVSEGRGQEEAQVLKEMADLGGQVLSLDPAALACEIPEAVRNVLYLPPLQLLAYYRTLAKGLNPDRPANLTAVITLDLGS